MDFPEENENLEDHSETGIDSDSESDLSSSSEAKEIIAEKSKNNDNKRKLIIDNIKKRSTFFNKKWISSYPWLRQDISNPFYARCTFCFTRFSIARGGDYHVKRHENTTKHKNLVQNEMISKASKNIGLIFEKPNDIKQSILAEAIFTFHTVKHSHSYLSADCTVNLLRLLFPDSKIGANISCGRTKMSKIITNVLKPASQKHILQELGNQPFSIATDASNKGNIKTFPLVISYFTKQSGVCRKLLCFFASESEKSKDIAEILLQKVKSVNLNVDNITAFCADNAAVNFGNKQSIYQELKKVNNDIQPVGCVCHIIHNAAKKAIEVFRYDIENIVLKVFNQFSSSTKNVTELKNFTEFVHQEWSEILRHTPTRWLSLVPAVERLLKMFQPLKSYFLSKESAPAYLKKFFDDDLAQAYLSVILHVGTNLNKTIALLESDTALITAVPGIIERLLELLNQEINEQFFGSFTSSELRKCNDLQAVERFKSECTIYLQRIIAYILKKNELQDRFKHLAFMELRDIPSFRELEMLCEKSNVKNVNYDDLFQEFVYLKAYMQNNLELLKALNTVEKWQNILQSENLPNLERIASYVFSIPHSNATSERIFSSMQNCWRKDRNKLALTTVEAELMIKFNFNFDCKEYKPFFRKYFYGQGHSK